MRVLFIARATLYSDPGGDTIQVLKTAEFLRKLDLEIVVRLTNEEIDYSTYDLLHFFNIIRPADILVHIEKSNKPFVVSTIYVDYSEYERKARGGLAGLAFSVFSSDFVEYLKVIARAVKNGERIISWKYLLLGQKRSINKILASAQMLLPNSESELNRLKRHYNVHAPYRVIPNAIDHSVFNGNEIEERDPNLVICVGRIEGRKNQLNLIKAVKATNLQLLIIGSSSINQREYYELCKRESGSNVQFIDQMAQADLLKFYRRAKVHALPSWFETTGLSSLEAAAMGCNIVVTDKGDTREYFEDYAFYCEPDLPCSILTALQAAANAANNRRLREKIFSSYTWDQTAKKTLEAYKEVLAKKDG